ncbi:hypothetical protein CYLTODRAFT_413629 [Cylindrobasidium torrendii FP15055 ss-10]|uniref:Uncharacterized protein n=1 Tax=Cylindrobasidium torrendii FP15055 ss-10 TaxID=1314674 RepID=A0A0D7B0L5_9AGAR|nr:hypothetical protein CYLTODRAFT_413629 [Cylindrobasidium torrendii FP15055 ss-10]
MSALRVVGTAESSGGLLCTLIKCRSDTRATNIGTRFGVGHQNKLEIRMHEAPGLMSMSIEHDGSGGRRRTKTGQANGSKRQVALRPDYPSQATLQTRAVPRAIQYRALERAHVTSVSPSSPSVMCAARNGGMSRPLLVVVVNRETELDRYRRRLAGEIGATGGVHRISC